MRKYGWMKCAVVALGATVFGGTGQAQPAAADAATTVSVDGATTASARGSRGDRGRMSGGLYRIALEVSNLTPEQKQKLEKMQVDYNEKMQEMRSKQSAAGTQNRRGSWGSPEFQKLMTDSKTEIESVLDDEQKKEFAAKVPARRTRGGSRETTAPKAE